MKIFKKSQSIRYHLYSSYLLIIGLLSVPTILLLLFLLPMTARYNQHIGYISDARDIIDLSGTELKTELWEIVSGNQSFEDSSQKEILNILSDKLDYLLDKTKTYESAQQLESASRLFDTLDTYILQLGTPPSRHSALYSNSQILREIYSVSDLLHTVLQEYIYLEISVISAINGQLRFAAIMITLLSILLLLSILTFIFDSCRTVQKNIQGPIIQLETMSVELAGGNLDARAAPPAVAELSTLTRNLNTMADQLNELIDSRIEDQLGLKKAEMRTLQAQITPHFIYNTLDTIVWLTQQNENAAVVDITMALTQFFRISLSGGNDYITVGQEYSHIKSYLEIQAVRYQSIMSYEIQIDEEIHSCPILKLLLQPLVENALYHGIKRQRKRGKIEIRGQKTPDHSIAFSVSDTGIGMTEAQLSEIRTSLSSSTVPQKSFGLYNVNQRIRLYYNNAGLSIKSTYGAGTIISFTIPISNQVDESQT